MAQHIIIGNGSPSAAPMALGQHYVDVLNGTVYISSGTASIADWKPSTSLTNEQLQDVIGPMFDNTASSPISTVYDDLNNKVVTSINQSQLDHNQIQNRGTNTHAQIDSHIANNSNPHGTTKAQVGLGSVDNTSDLDKPISNSTQSALNNKINISEKGVAGGVATLGLSGTIPSTQIPLLPYAPSTHAHVASDITNFNSTVETLGDARYSLLNHGHPNATPSSSGFMSPSDKSKLDGLNNSVYPKTTITLSNSSNVTYTNISELQINCVAGKTYKFKYFLRHLSNATATGITFSMNGTASGSLGAKAFMSTSRTAVSIPSINAFAGAMAINAVPSTGPELTTIEGLFVCTANGTMYPQFRSELNGSQVQVLDNSILEYNEL